MSVAENQGEITGSKIITGGLVKRIFLPIIVIWATLRGISAPEEDFMKRLVEFPLEDGSSILVEVEENEGQGLTKVSLKDGIEKAQQTFEKSLDKVRPAAQYILEKLRTLHDSPDEIEVQFGLKLNAGSGVILAAGVEANYTVKLKWVKEKTPTKPKKK